MVGVGKKNLACIGGILMAINLTSCMHVSNTLLPDYVTINCDTMYVPTVLRTPAQKVTFPLSLQDKQDINKLEKKFDNEENCAGLAAPQIGISKQIIVFALPEDEELKKFRPDFTQTMDKTIWINPSYVGIGREKSIDYELCISVPDRVGFVERYKRVTYQAYTPEGKFVTGEAEGLLARAIQHEIDHVHGKLYIDYVPKGKLLTIAEFRKQIAETSERNRQDS